MITSAMTIRRMIGSRMLKYLGASSMVAANAKGMSSINISMMARTFCSLGKVVVSAYSGFFYFTLSRRVFCGADV
jgi:hypothetical protein